MKFWTKEDKNTFEDEIESVLNYMTSLSPDTEEYEHCVRNLEVLTRAKGNDRTRSVNPDTILASATNLAGILMILGYEHVAPVASKAFGLLVKTRL